MASIIRHGPAGSYKSSYAVWFELLPALREGRIVITNVEGMENLDDIEHHMGERFPTSARIIRISSQTTKGKNLWQNWYNWCPLGAFILIDEAQDIFNKTQGFIVEKNVFQGVQAFQHSLPDNFVDYYERVRAKFKPEDAYVDDIGERIVDSNGNIIMPADFKEAFQRHRKYNWDLVLCTPNIKYIGDEVKSVSEFAVAHSSRDGILPWSKRKTRLFNHDPRSTSIKPTKDDAVDIQKIPLEVHLLYKSTATGSMTKTKKGRPLWKEPKLIMATVALIVGISTFLNGLTKVNSDATSTDINQVQDNQVVSSGSQAYSLDLQETQTSPNQSSQQAGSTISPYNNHSTEISSNNFLHQMGLPLRSNNILNVPLPVQITEFYVSSLVVKHGDYFNENFITFEAVKPNGKKEYFNSEMLERLGYKFTVADDCLISISFNDLSDYVLCRTHIEHDIYEDHVDSQDFQVAQVEDDVISLF